MTTSVEKLVCQIFERKKWIIEQVKQQIYLYEQHLASNLLIEGINPPPWFLNPNSHSLSSDPKELNKEELIADLLLPHARPTFPYSTGQCYLQNRLVVTGDSSELLDTLPKDIQESNKDLVEGDELRPLHESRGNDVVYTADCALRHSYASSYNEADARVSDFSNKSGQSPVKSQRSQQLVKQDTGKVSDGSLLVVHDSTNGPEGGIELMTMPDRSDMDPGCMLSSVPKCFLAEKTEARVSNNNLAPDQSLAIFQRSRSRQKALEIRTSAKATRSRKSHKNKSISYSGVPLYGIDPEEPDHSKDFSLMAKSFNTNKGSSGERVASSSLSIKNGRSNNCGSITNSENTCRRPKSGNEHLKLDVSHENVRKDSANESCDMRQAKGIDASMENGASGYCGRTTRSKSTCIQHICLNEYLENGRCSTVEYKTGCKLSHNTGSGDPLVCKEMEAVVPFHVSEETSDMREEGAMEKYNVMEQESSKCMGRMMRSMSSSGQPGSVNDSLNDAVGLNKHFYIPMVDNSTCGGSTGKLNQQGDKANEVPEMVKPSPEIDSVKSSKEAHDKEVQVSSVASVSIANFAVAHSKSGAAEEYPLASLLNQSNGDTLTNLSGNRSILLVAETDATANQEKKIPSATAIEFEGHPPCLKYNIDNVNSRTDSEGSVVKLPYDVPFVVKPKQLNFDALEDCSINEQCSLPYITKSMEQSSQGKCHKSLDPEVSLEKSTSDPYKVSLEKQLMELSEVSKENQKARKSFVSNTDECSENDTASEPFKNGNQEVNHSEDDLKAALYQSQPPNEKYVSPSDLRKGSHVDICQSNCHLTEVYPVQHLDTGHFCSERSSRSGIIPPTLENQCSGSLAIPCLTKLATEDPESLLDKELIMKKQSDDLLDARQCSSVDSENNLLLHKRNISCEKVDNLAGTEKMTSVEGYFNLIEERINICASSGDPQDEDAHISSLKFGETLPTYISSFSKNRSRHTKVDSWPQCKRRKIEYQQTNCFSASPSCRVQKLHNIHGEHISSHSKTIEKELDAFSELPGVTFSHLRNGSESSDMFHGKMECHLTDGTLSMPIIKNQQEEAGYGTEEQSQVIGTPSTSEHGELGPCFISSLCKQATTGSHGSYVEHTTSDPGEEILTAENLSAEQDFQKFFYSCNVDNLEDNDILEQSQVIGTPSTSEHGELGPCFISSLCKQATTGSHGSYVEHTTSDPSEEILTAENLSAEQDFQKFFYSCNVDNLEDNDILTSTQSALLDNNCGLKGELAGSTCNSELAFDQDLPVFEAFVLNEPSDNGGLDPSGDGINFSELNTTHTSMNRASVLEHICRTASMCTPLSHFPSAYNPLKNKDLYLSAPERLLERPDIASTLSFIEDAGSHPHTSTDEANSSLRGMLYSDSLPYSSSSRYSWSSKNSDTPAAGKYCERISSSSFSSGKRLSSNPELTCFPIEEDPCVDETENADEDDDDDHIQKDIGLADINSCANEEPLFERMEVCPNPPASVSAAEKYHHIGLDCSNTGVQSSVKHRLRNHCSNKKSKNWGKENQVSSVGANSSIKVNESLRFSKAKLSSTTSIKRGAQRLSEKVKRNNIVSNVTSFIPLVQQKQAAAVVKGKRDIKVRALEAAEAAKRLEEQKENERKVKKEALKLERAKIEQETLRQKELDKRKKEEELKKKDADLAARKRLREEEGRKEKERKRKRIEVGLRTQRAAEEKVFAGKGEKEKQCGNRVKNANNRMESNNRARQDRNVDKVSADGSTMKRPESQTEFKTTGYDIQQVSTVPENCETLGDCDGTQTKSMLDQIPSESGVATKTSHEKSYEMSPYQHSDDEEEEEDDLPAKKFTPSWASKYCVGLVLPSQQQIDPSVIFPRESFCSMDEVLLPRHLTSK